MDEAQALLLSNRRYLYALVSRAFAHEPDEGLLAEMRGPHVEAECTLLDDDLHEGAEAVAATRRFAGANMGQRLSSEYTKLFIGPGSLPASPWESVYVTGEPLLFQESTLAVRNAYRRAGYVALGYPREADDHVAIELDFMATLASDTCEAHASADGARIRELLSMQLAFLNEHLLVWLESFAERLHTCDTVSGFYPSIAHLAVLVCRRDAGVLQELLAA